MKFAILLAMLQGALGSARRRARRAGASAMVALLAAIGLALVVAALGVTLGRQVGTIGALLIFAGAFLFFALIGWIVLLATRHRGRVMPMLGTAAAASAATSVVTPDPAPPPRRRRWTFRPLIPRGRAPLAIGGALLTGFLLSQVGRRRD